MGSSSSPPILPISSSTVQSPDPTVPILPPRAAAFRDTLSKLADTTRHALAHQRPWPELLSISSFSRPESFSEALSRLRTNTTHFRTNYSLLIAAVIAFSLLSNPFSLLLLLVLAAAWAFLYLLRPSDRPLAILGREFSDFETLAGLVVFSIFVVFLTSVGSVVMSAVAVGALVVAVHGAFRVPDDLFLDESGGAGAGLISRV